MNRAVVCSPSWLASLGDHSAVGERYAVVGAIGLALIAVLVVDCVVLWLAALDLDLETRQINKHFTTTTHRHAASNNNSLGLQLKVIYNIYLLNGGSECDIFKSLQTSDITA